MPVQQATLTPLVIPRIVFEGGNVTSGEHESVSGAFLVWLGPGPHGCRCVIAMLDERGYPFPIRGLANPWAHISAKKERIANSIKLPLDDSHTFFLVAHPDPSSARQLAELVEKAVADGGQLPSTPHRLKMIALKASKKSSEVVYGFQIPRTNASFWPPGPEASGGWLLYRRMPYAELEPVKEQVAKLRRALGALYYPATDTGFDPYAQLGKSESPGEFSIGVQAALAQFQHDAAACQCARRASQAGPWSVLFDPVENAPSLKSSTPLVPGLADAATLDAIGAWHQARVRKPGAVLVRVSQSWLRVEAAIAHLAFCELCTALGLLYSPTIGSTLRNVAAAGGNGRSEYSNHKVGLAIDYRSGDFVEPSAEYPVAFEAVWTLDDRQLQTALAALNKARMQLQKMEKKGKSTPDELALQEAKVNAATEAVKIREAQIGEDPTKSSYDLSFHLYGHSSLDPLLAPATETLDFLTHALAEARSRFAARLRDEVFGTTDLHPEPDPELRAAFDDWLGPHLEHFDRACSAILEAASPPESQNAASALAMEFFRADIRRFQWDGFEEDGGTTRIAVDAASDAKRYRPEIAPRAKSWLNLSRVAYHAGLWTIGSRKGEFKFPVTNPAASQEKRKPKVEFQIKQPNYERYHWFVQAVRAAVGQLGWTEIHAKISPKKVKGEKKAPAAIDVALSVGEIDLEQIGRRINRVGRGRRDSSVMGMGFG
jgi:hypothetical protein